MLLIILILLVVAYLIYDTTKRYEMIKYGSKMPGDFALPFIGNYFQMCGVKTSSDLFYKLRDMVAKYAKEELFRVWVGQILTVVVFRPDHLEIIASLPETSTKGYIYNSAVGNTFNGVVIVSGGPRWRELRKPVTMSMKVHYLENNYYNVFVRRTNDFIKFVRENREEKMFDCMSDICALFLEFIAETHLGVPMNEVSERRWNVSDNTERILKTSILGTMKYGLNYWQYVEKFKKNSSAFEKNKQRTLEFLKWVLNERERISSSLPEKKDVCEYYTDFLLRRKKEMNLSEKDICHELADVIEAGFDTSSLFAGSALLFLAMHPEVQERAYQEQLEIFGDSDRDPTLEDIKSMKYLELIFKETSRHVTSPGSFRLCTANIKLGKYLIPKGAIVFAYFHWTHMDPKYWEKPHEFYPEHFLPEKEESRPKFAYIPFGFGLRMCAGKNYGILSVMVVLSTILRHYKLTTQQKFQDILYEFVTFAYIEQRYNITLKKRNNNKSYSE